MNKAYGLQKLPQLFADCTVTEVVDGLVTAVDIRPKQTEPFYRPAMIPALSNSYANHEAQPTFQPFTLAARKGRVYEVRAIAGKRWVTPALDNHGFADWVWDHVDDLVKLGPGRHVGRWWGKKINREYGLDERRFSLVNYERWSGPDKPDCVHVLPMVYKGRFNTELVSDIANEIATSGSYAAPGFMKPFGLIVYHHGMNNMFRVTLEHGDKHCWCDPELFPVEATNG